MAHRFFWLLVFFLFCLGCDSGPKSYPVEGQVVYSNGEHADNLKDGSLEFTPVGNSVSARASILANGKFVMSTRQSADGALPGDYLVSIVPPETEVDKPVVRVLDPKYSDPNQSGLKVTIKPEKNVLKLTIEKFKK
ncbi:MAG: hypothetical protein EXR99_08140 [Gemmataceae bacterium]|nr:hypothetical protein [Gemmataceae bacterium]